MKKQNANKKVTCIPLVEGTVNSASVFVTDPQGSYTGVPADPLEQPVQDADDL